jgi:DNA replication protein DnaC
MTGETTVLRHPTIEKLQQLKLAAMARELAQQRAMPEAAALSFEERLGLLADCELTERDSRRLSLRLRSAKLRESAAIEDLDTRAPRGLDKALILLLVTCQWIAEHMNCLITGPTGIGKTWLACALAHKAAREGYSVLYARLPKLFTELDLGRADGRYPKLIKPLGRVDVLVLDDLAMAPMSDAHRRDLLEIIDDRYQRRSTIVTSQIPVKQWHAAIGEPTLADAILDRLVHNAYKIAMSGKSMRDNPKLTPANQAK